MMRQIPLLFFFILLSVSLAGQVNKFGTPLTTTYTMQVTQGSENNWSVTKDKFGVIYFGNDDNMVLRYDGSKWSTIPLNPDNETVVRSLGSDDRGIIYVGGSNEFGYIQPDSTGKQVYVSLSTRLSQIKDITFLRNDSVPGASNPQSEFTVGEIKSLLIDGNNIFFLSPGTLIIYNNLTDSLSYINLRKLGYRKFERMASINGKIILGSNVFGLFEFRDGKITQMPGGGFFKRKTCLSFLPYSDSRAVVGTLDAGIYLYDYNSGAIDSTFISKSLQWKFRNKVLWIYNGVKLYSGDYAFGTTADGVYVFDSKGNNTGHWTTSNTGMLDNSVSALFVDPGVNSELWICTTGSVTKAFVNLPFTEIGDKAGIVGSINSFCKFNGATYVSTDKGLYKSIINEDGSVTYSLFNNISSEIFPLAAATVGRDSFLLAGSTFNGVNIIDPSGRVELLKGSKINARDEIVKNGFVARSLLQSSIRKNRFFIGKNTLGIAVLDYENGHWNFIENIPGSDGMTLYMCELPNGDLIFMTRLPDGIYKFTKTDSKQTRYGVDKGVPDGAALTCLEEVNGDMILSTSVGLFKYNIPGDFWEPCDAITGGYTSRKYIDGVAGNADGSLWVTTKESRYHDIFITRRNDSTVMYSGGVLAMLPDQKFLFSCQIEGRTWLQKAKTLYVIDESRLNESLPGAQTLFSKIVKSSHGSLSTIMVENFSKKDANGRRYPMLTDSSVKPPEFNYKYNSLSFYWTTPYMTSEEQTLYSYKLEGFDFDWSKWDRVSYKDYTNLPYGKYTFRVKGNTVTGIETREAVYTFVILKPWYATFWMIILYIIATGLGVFGLIAAYTKRLKNENIRLEGIVAERTAVVVKQKEELESSIHYASRIQMALLPSQQILSENIKNYFVLFKPRDIVSGDFYWMTKKNERLYIVAADCTGHGVPGAFMSLLGMSFLDEIIEKQAAPRANEILNQLRQHVTDSLKQVGGDDEAKDGMDMALLVIDFNSQRIEFSGAYNPCFKVRKLAESEIAKYEDDSVERPDGSMSNGKYLLETIYASKMPIGISSRMNENFVFYDWQLERGISYYLFSDGYIDQFGGEHGRKFMKKNFKKLILEIQDQPMNRQKELLDKNLKDWMGQSPQIDDILVMGIRTE
jgi:serine phosphatase RsbU (regulator of sigma subunit)